MASNTYDAIEQRAHRLATDGLMEIEGLIREPGR